MANLHNKNAAGGSGFTEEELQVIRSANQLVMKEDPSRLHGSDHPGMILVANQLTGNNYMSWSRSMLIALGAKTKLGYIDGRIVKPEEDSPNYDQWKCVDLMVTSWILNSISKDIVDAFIYANSARELWVDLGQRFGESNGPLQKEIANLRQGNVSVVIYFTKLKKLWDEYCCLVAFPDCTCGAAKVLLDMDTKTKLMQFLMGLNDSYENVRSQILLMDPLPTVNRAYSMILTVEKQRSVQIAFPEAIDGVAMSVRSCRGVGIGTEHANMSVRGGRSNWQAGRGRGYRMTKEEKARLKCSYCGDSGHEVGTCFKVHGYPEWFAKLKEQRKRENANLVEIPTEHMNREERTDGGYKYPTRDISSIVQQEIAKYLGGNKQADNSGKENTGVDFAHYAEYAGPED